MRDRRYDNYVEGGQSSGDIKARMEQAYNAAYTVNGAYWQQATIDKKFKVGDQTLWSYIYGASDYQRSKRFFFNKIRKHVNMITGHQRRNRKSTIVVPQADGDDALADDYTAVQIWSENRENAQSIYSQSFENGVDVGMDLIHLYPDYTYDPVSGDLGLESIPYNSFIIDPYFRSPDLSDCNFIWRRRWVSKEGAKVLLPGRADEIDKMHPCSAKDGKFQYQAELFNLDLNRMYVYDEYYYRDFREADIVVDPFTGEAVEWTENVRDQEGELDQILIMQPHLRTKKIQKPTVKQAILLNGRLMYDGPNVLGIDRYPFAPTLCYYEPDVLAYQWRIQGVIRNLRDAQFLYNRRKIIELDILESQINSGWIFPVDAVVDEKALRQTENGYLVPLKKGHSADEIKRIDPPSIPQSMIELSKALSDDITEISGVNEELLGSADDEKAGILSMLRQSAGLTTLHGIFDRMDNTQRLVGSLRLEAIRKNFSKGKIRRILGRDPHPKFFLSDASKYDVAIEEGQYSTTQRQLELSQLLHFKQIGMPIPDEAILRASFIQNKAQLIEDVQQQAQAQQQMQQAQAQEQQQKSQIDNMLTYAKSRSELARANEAMASSAQKITSIQEIQANAEHKRVLADVDLVKELIALEHADMASLKQAIEVSEQIRQHNQYSSQGVRNA